MKILRKTAKRTTLGNVSTSNSKGPSPISVNEWMTAYLEVASAKEDTVPEGYLTVDEIAKGMKVCQQVGSERVNALHRAGKAERIKLRRLFAGRIKIVPYYKLSVARSSTS